MGKQTVISTHITATITKELKESALTISNCQLGIYSNIHLFYFTIAAYNAKIQ